MKNIHNFALRLPKQLYKKLIQSAKKNERSINSEIVFAIKQYLGYGYTDDNQKQKEQ